MKKIATVATSLALWTLVCGPSAHGAEVYKWVDEKGRTHYGQQGPAAGNAKTKQIKVATPPASPPKPAARASEPQGWAKEPAAPPPAETRAPQPKESAIPRPDAVETDASRCRLARAILSGEVRHTNGAQTDANDRQIAQNDVRTYCGK